MSYIVRRAARSLAFVFLLGLASLSAPAAENKHLAPGFSTLPSGATIVLMPPDVELFEMGASGMLDPKADWTEAAQKNIRTAIETIEQGWNLSGSELSESDAEAYAEVNRLHAAVAESISLHHFAAGRMALPTKAGRLDWSFGDAVGPLHDKTQADYALFIWMRDSYSSGGRVAAQVALAVLGVVATGGAQVGYASLVDLRTGQVMWFNQLARHSGDLRKSGVAADTLKVLLKDFPFPR
jgi:hypothetical protein